MVWHYVGEYSDTHFGSVLQLPNEYPQHYCLQNASRSSHFSNHTLVRSEVWLGVIRSYALTNFSLSIKSMLGTKDFKLWFISLVSDSSLVFSGLYESLLLFTHWSSDILVVQWPFRTEVISRRLTVVGDTLTLLVSLNCDFICCQTPILSDSDEPILWFRS